ncbi:MAG: carboxypeptidase regulatory-like domain-containing protein, partial [ANME-2 cluster archaeon]|nr:carboxypeptidase regulatory-like domain-containing protein [ANME-2 cluster archaeon]
LSYVSGSTWEGTIVALAGTNSVNVSSSDAVPNTAWDNTSTYTATTPDTCLGCHGSVSTPDIGLHSTLSGTSVLDNGDCDTCHNKSGISVPMIPGGANSSNTYYCADCHTGTGTGPNISTIQFTDKQHGEVSCVDCHIADGTYHQDNPKGAVANTMYVNRFVPGDTTVTNCADCHYASNLDDAPFYAPGAGSHVTIYGGGIGACSSPGCHVGTDTNTMTETMHNLSGDDIGTQNPVITTPVLSLSTVTSGTAVIVTTTASVGGTYDLVDGAQYRIENSTGEVVAWTPMNADDGDFDGTSETVNVTIDTSGMLGNYTIQVRAMGGGIAQSNLIRYYPMNGDVSGVLSTTLTVESPKGYINGTITSSGLPVAGALVSTKGVSSVSDSNGNYSLRLLAGTYNVSVSKLPEYDDNLVTGVEVTVETTTIQDIPITTRPLGTIQGTVKN